MTPANAQAILPIWKYFFPWGSAFTVYVEYSQLGFGHTTIRARCHDHRSNGLDAGKRS